ncbi:protein AATF-like [Scylla paramamosain]|uniref:protein AATF-like n=1 Tax=Scylla paramamosain TaxID=85552 RepID=UPI003082A988
MSSALKSYVEKYLLNPGASFNVDDDGNEETKAQVVDSLLDEERVDVRQQPLSKLRARRAALEAEKDPRYKGKKVLRKDLKKDNEVDFDPELAKFCIMEGSEDDDEEGEEEEDGDEEEEEEEEEEQSDDENNDKLSRKMKKLGTNEFEEEEDGEDEDDEGSSEENEEVKKLYQDLQRKQEGVTFIDDGDFSKFADDVDEEEDDDDEEEEEEEEDEGVQEDMDMEDTQQKEGPLRKFRQEDSSEEVKRGQAVKNQLGIYDSLFEGRICMQKVVVASNQLPQHDTYKLFLREQDPNYLKNLTAARVASKKLLDSLLQIQELLLRQYPETNHIVTGKAAKDTGTESNEEITSSEEEEQQQQSVAAAGEGFKGVKRKMKVEEYEEVLSKRHAAVLPFRDQTINKWYEKTRLLSSHSARGNRFSGFETSALQQLHNILANREPLVRRTQMTGTTRGATYHVLGRHRESTKVEDVEYDSEIFDDTDFYTRSLEEVLKAKVSLSDNMTDVSRKWIEIQNLRRKAKKKVDKKASKGRKLRYEVMSKLQQYMAPSHSPQMDDSAINTLFASLFGKSLQKQRLPKTQ